MQTGQHHWAVSYDGVADVDLASLEWKLLRRVSVRLYPVPTLQVLDRSQIPRRSARRCEVPRLNSGPVVGDAGVGSRHRSTTPLPQ